MTHDPIPNALWLLQAADAFRAKLSGEFSAVHGLSVNEFLLMSHLAKAANQRLSRVELARRLYVSASTVTRMVAPMEKIGLVAREADERDARIGYVGLTEAGKIRLSEAEASFAKQAGYLFQDRWSDAELDTLSSLLHRLVIGTPGAILEPMQP